MSQRLMRPLTPTMRSFVAHIRFQNMVGAQRLRDMVKETIPNNKADRTALKQLAVGQPDTGVTVASSPVPPPTTNATVSA